MENWKEVAGFPGYEVSDQGRVRSYYKRVGKGRGNGRGARWDIVDKPQRVLSGGTDKGSGYIRVILMRDGTQYGRAVHALVLRAFVGPRPDGMEACHNDGHPANNRLDNLRYDTHSSNIHDSVRHGNRENCRAAAQALSDDEAIAIRQNYPENPRAFRIIGREYGVSPTLIRKLIHGITYTDVGGPRSPTLGRRTYTDETIAQIRADYRGGKAYRQLATEYDIDIGHLSRIIKNISRPDPNYTPPEHRHPIPPETHRKFSDDEIRQMREMRAGGAKCREIARRFAISRSYLGKILSNRARPCQPRRD